MSYECDPRTHRTRVSRCCERTKKASDCHKSPPFFRIERTLNVRLQWFSVQCVHKNMKIMSKQLFLKRNEYIFQKKFSWFSQSEILLYCFGWFIIYQLSFFHVIKWGLPSSFQFISLIFLVVEDQLDRNAVQLSFITVYFQLSIHDSSAENSFVWWIARSRVKKNCFDFFMGVSHTFL